MSTKQNNTSINTSNFIPSVLIIAFLMVGFLPNLNAVDKIAPQWLYLSALNIISALYIFYNKNYFLIPIIKTVKSKISFFYIAFFIWMSLSFFYPHYPLKIIGKQSSKKHKLTYFIVRLNTQ